MLADAKCFVNAKIPVSKTRTSWIRHKARRVTECEGRRLCERTGIEPLSHFICVCRSRARVARDVRPLPSTKRIGVVGSRHNAQRKTALERDDAADLPSTEDSVSHRIPVRSDRLTFAD